MFLEIYRAYLREYLILWLWDACNHALNADIEPTDFVMEGGRLFRRVRDRVRPTKDALEMTKMYPMRPDKLLPPSPSVNKLRAVLAALPRLPTGDIEWHEWSAECLAQLFAAILDVVDEHKTGWATVRWEIYDKVYCRTR
ncbi:hypothetical protein V8D89_010526 [Ganoderma adspersum]